MNITDIDKTKCMSCGRKYPHKTIYWLGEEIQQEEGIKEVKHLFNCARCRTLYDKINDCEFKIRKGYINKLNFEYELFRRKTV